GNRDVWIALALLQKRAFSSAHALWRSVTRRLDTLTDEAPAATQLVLPLDEDGEVTDADETPPWQDVLGLRDRNRERRLLTSLADAAATCARAESKVRVIRGLLRRIAEPLIIFTEYRDTLGHLARQIDEPLAMLHGGLSRVERLSALELFARGRVRILLATDAASEGLNLHHTCRTVVNLELPWNPMRLEQRIGRVDRIGQTRTVHAFHLVGSETGELGLLDELRRRIAHAQADIGAPDPLDGVLNDEVIPPMPSDAADVSAELVRLRLRRALTPETTDDRRPLAAVARNRRTRAKLGLRRLLMWECNVEDGFDRAAASALISTLSRSECVVEPSIAAARIAAWQSDAVTAAQRFSAVAIERAEAIVRSIERDEFVSMQPGLFDRRAHFAHAALKAVHDDALAAQRERKDRLMQAGRIAVRPPQLRLLLLPRP